MKLAAMVHGAVNRLREVLAQLWLEVRRLNSLGLPEKSGAASRASRRAALRSALTEKYRGHSPCC